jgi:NAD(P)H-hydrate epimerase
LFSPDGNRYVFSDGHPSLAKAGSGDVLTGIILALLAQGLEVKDAACLGLVIHGAAARLASEQTGMAGMCIEDLIFGISSYLKQCGY